MHYRKKGERKSGLRDRGRSWGRKDESMWTEDEKDIKISITVMTGQLRRAYHSMLYKHINMPLPVKSMTHIKTFQLRLETLSVRKMKPTANSQNYK